MESEVEKRRKRVVLNNVHSQVEVIGSAGDVYTVTHYDIGKWHCTCLGFENYGRCKHIRRYQNERVTDHQTALPENKKGSYTDEEFRYIFKHCSLEDWDSLNNVEERTFLGKTTRKVWLRGKNNDDIAKALQRSSSGITTALHILVKNKERFEKILSESINIENEVRKRKTEGLRKAQRRRRIEEDRQRSPRERKARKQKKKLAYKSQKEKAYKAPERDAVGDHGTTYWSVLYELDFYGNMKYHVKNGRTGGNHPTTRTVNWGPLVCWVERNIETQSHAISREQLGQVTLPITRQGGTEFFGAFDTMQEAVEACFKLGRLTAEKYGLTLEDYWNKQK